MEFFIGVVVLACLILATEYRFRKPDRLIVRETNKGFSERKSLLYPRHFSLLLTRTTHTFQLTIDATAKGNLDVRAVLSASVAAAAEHLDALIRVGGWSSDAVAKASKVLEGQLQSYVKEYAEQHSIEQLSTQNLLQHLERQVPGSKDKLGIEVVSLTLLSFEPGDPKISEALREQEHARIVERTEDLRQQARIAAARTKLRADEEIAVLENELELKKYEMKRVQLQQESTLADLRTDEELVRNRKRLMFDKEEFDMLKGSPELLMLTPQAARLAEASQGLKNARTVVSLSPQDLGQGADLIATFQRLLQSAMEARTGRADVTSTK
jgi:hypothetical protein